MTNICKINKCHVLVTKERADQFLAAESLKAPRPETRKLAIQPGKWWVRKRQGRGP